MNNLSKIKVIAGVRYFVDCDYSTDSGITWKREEDNNDNCEKMKTIIPLIKRTNIGYSENDYWCLEIDYNSGKIKDWPQNFCIKTFFKVCDDGLYQIIDTNNNVIWDSIQSKYYYVPDFLALENEGYGDYIFLNINNNGLIEHWDNAKKLIDKILNYQLSKCSWIL